MNESDRTRLPTGDDDGTDRGEAVAPGGEPRDDALWQLVRTHHAPPPLEADARAALLRTTRSRLERRATTRPWIPALAGGLALAAAAAILVVTSTRAPQSGPEATLDLAATTASARAASVAGGDEGASVVELETTALEDAVPSQWSASYADALPADYALLEAEIFPSRTYSF